MSFSDGTSSFSPSVHISLSAPLPLERTSDLTLSLRKLTGRSLVLELELDLELPDERDEPFSGFDLRNNKHRLNVKISPKTRQAFLTLF